MFSANTRPQARRDYFISVVFMTCTLVLCLITNAAEAQRPVAKQERAKHRAEHRADHRVHRHYHRTGPYRPSVRWVHPRSRVVVRPRVVVPPVRVAPRVRVYGGIHIHRRFGPAFFGYGFYYADNDALPWIAFTLITLKLLDNLNEEQVRYHEQAQIDATKAEVGESIVWEKGDASGSVTTLRQGKDSAGRQCREFHHTINIGGETEDAYGTACLQDDGSWKMTQ